MSTIGHEGLPRPDLRARLADAFTLARVGLAVALVPLLGGGRHAAAGLALAAAWISDALDGALARTGKGSRLGRWDVLADAAVGAGAAVGLALAGSYPPWLVGAAILVFGGLLIAGNLAAGMLLQLMGFVPVLWRLWAERPPLWWVPFAAAVVIGVVEWRKLVHVNIPSFLRGVAGRFER